MSVALLSSEPPVELFAPFNFRPLGLSVHPSQMGFGAAFTVPPTPSSLSGKIDDVPVRVKVSVPGQR